ncbi:hypothetical protein CP960_08355 [Malaciobacter halophilus]|uniref:Cobalt ABC transporter permease n=1 Tax=Malaciobacter halophilus TaxID=197482 RepID=A0A2N1J288_9BACT|nr:hypothetical protein [Malaciobacter halophilus]AXH10534.1 cobalt/nickel ECF transporter CbiMNQO, S component CbiN [Malaciobacter halophilus]PKI80669.1 hypothetical protein CP960_08355 [Malaciobacter halophilus]
MRLIFLLTFLCLSLFAHRLNLFTTYEEDNLFINAYFANGNGCQNCKITIKDENGNVIKNLFTDKKGEAILKLPKNNVTLIVDAKGGHIVTKKLTFHKATKKSNTKNIEEESKSKLQMENEKLKAEIKSLQAKLEAFNFLKTIFALLVIIGIFYILKRVKR